MRMKSWKVIEHSGKFVRSFETKKDAEIFLAFGLARAKRFGNHYNIEIWKLRVIKERGKRDD